MYLFLSLYRDVCCDYNMVHVQPGSKVGNCLALPPHSNKSMWSLYVLSVCGGFVRIFPLPPTVQI